jgi:CRP-like cAMP-binding protein
MERITTDELRKIPAFSRFPQQELVMMIRLGNILLLRKDRNISYQKDPCSSCSLILSGMINKKLYLTDGGTMKIGTGEVGNWIGVTELVQKGPFLYDSRTITESVIMQFTQHNFQQLMDGKEFNRHIVQQLSREIVLLHRSMEYSTPRARIILFLRDSVTISTKGIATLTLTQQEIARETGTTRETVNRYLRELERSSIIKTARGSIDVLNLNELDTLVCNPVY